MSTETDKGQERKFWQLGGDDKWMLYIAFLGTVAGGVALVLIVGLGLLEVHLIHRWPHSLATVVLPQLWILLVSIVPSFVLTFYFGRKPDEDFDKARFLRTWSRVLLGIAMLLGTIIVLALVGYADGIK